jgi:hypothetical protein
MEVGIRVLWRAGHRREAPVKLGQWMLCAFQ